MITFLLFLALPLLIMKHILLFIKCGFGFMLASKMDTLGDFFQDIFSFFNLYFEQCIEPSLLFGHLWNPLRLTCSPEFIANTAHMEIETWGLCRGHLEVWLTPNSFFHNILSFTTISISNWKRNVSTKQVTLGVKQGSWICLPDIGDTDTRHCWCFIILQLEDED